MVHVPALRERPEDILLIAQHFLTHWCQEQKLSARSFSAEALEALNAHSWPGNVRELQSRIKRAAVAADRVITAEDLGLAASPAIDVESLKTIRSRAEREAVRRAMAQSEGNISEAARLLDVSRPPSTSCCASRVCGSAIPMKEPVRLSMIFL